MSLSEDMDRLHEEWMEFVRVVLADRMLHVVLLAVWLVFLGSAIHDGFTG